MEIIKKIWRLLPLSLRGKIGNLLRSCFDGFCANKFASKISKNPPIPKDYCIIGFFAATNGHSMATKLLVKDLEKSGFHPRRMDISEVLQSPLDDNVQTISEAPRKDDALIFVVNPDQIIYLLRNIGDEFIGNRKIIGYFVWELETPPDKWRIARELFHEIWTPSNFSKAALGKIFDCPIHVVPHAVALNPPPKFDEHDAAEFRRKFGISDTDFVAFQSFSFSSSLARKNVFAAIDAFELAFVEARDAVFMIRHQNGARFPNALKRLAKKVSQTKSRIVLLAAKGDQSEVFVCYEAANCYISLHQSEGFGLNLAESMMVGLPVICSNWSGNLDFMDDKCACLVDTKPINVFDEDKIYKGRNLFWASADINQAADYLVKLKNDPAYSREIATRARRKIIDTLSGTNFNFE